MKFCIFCGEKMEDDDLFCPACGKMQEEASAVKPKSEIPTKYYNSTPIPNPPKKSNTALIVAVSVLSAALVFALGILVYNLIKDEAKTVNIEDEIYEELEDYLEYYDDEATWEEAAEETTAVTEEVTHPAETETVVTETEAPAPSVYVPNGVWGPTYALSEPYILVVQNTNGKGLLMRSGPGKSYNKLSNGRGKNVNLPDGTVVTVLGYDYVGSNWYYVTANGFYGWCCGYADNTTYLY